MLKINVCCVSDSLDSDDEGVEGVYQPIFDDDVTQIALPKLAQIALDIFHEEIGISNLDNFEITVIDENGSAIDWDDTHTPYSASQSGCVEKISDTPMDINGDIQINIEPNSDQHRGGFEWTVSNGDNILDSGLAPTEEDASTEAEAAKQAYTIKGEEKDAAKAIGSDGNPIAIGLTAKKTPVFAVTYECVGFTDDRTVCDRGMSENEAMAFSEVAIAEKTLPTFVRGVVRAQISEDDGQGNDSIKVFVMVTLLIEADEETIEKQFKPPSHLLSRIADVMIGEDGDCPITIEDSWHALEIEETVLPDQLRSNKIPVQPPVKLSDNSPTP